MLAIAPRLLQTYIYFDIFTTTTNPCGGTIKTFVFGVSCRYQNDVKPMLRKTLAWA